MLQLDKLDDEILRDDSNYIATTVKNWEAREGVLQQAHQMFNRYYAFHSHWIMGHYLVSSHIFALFRAVVPEQGDLLSSQSSLIDRPVEGVSHLY